MGKPPVLIPTAGKPLEVALMTAPDAYTGYLRPVPDGVELRNEVAARIDQITFLDRQLKPASA
jgi:uncharacterized protein